MRVPCVCLTGVDTTLENGKLRVIMAVVSNGAFDAELRLKNETPEGQTRFAIVGRSLEVGANAVGIDVPLTEAGVHTIAAELFARYTDDGEMVSVFAMAPTKIDVPVSYNGLFVDSATITVNQEEGVVEIYTAVRRTSEESPRNVTMIVRDGSRGTAALVSKELTEEITVVGLRAEVDAGIHLFNVTLAVDVDGELTEVLPVNPVRV